MMAAAAQGVPQVCGSCGFPCIQLSYFLTRTCLCCHGCGDALSQLAAQGNTLGEGRSCERLKEATSLAKLVTRRSNRAGVNPASYMVSDEIGLGSLLRFFRS